MRRERTRQKRTRQRPAGKAGPSPGWKGLAAVGFPRFVNPRPPAVPSTLDLRLDEYYAAASLMGLLAASTEEPDQKWACEWAVEMGARMARAAVKRRKQR
jgi:hypothetical protein